MENQADNEKRAQKAKEMMDDKNFELDVDALEDAAGGIRIKTGSGPGQYWDFDTYDD